MRLVLQRKGARLTIRCPPTGNIYEFRENCRTIDVHDQGDIGYILGVHGASVQPEVPTADGWLLYSGDEPQHELDLLTGAVTLPRGVPIRVAIAQQIEAQEREHWPPVPPAATYGWGMRRLLVTRDMGLGDMLMLCSALRALKARCPDIEITLSTQTGWARLLADQPGIDRLTEMGYENAGGPYDQHMMLVQWVERAPSRFERHRTDVFAEPLGVDHVENKAVAVPLSAEERREGQQRLAGAKRPLVGVVYRGSTNARSYPKHMVPGLCGELDARGFGVALIDHHPWPDFPLPPDAVRLCGTEDARSLAAAVAAMDCVVSPDTGVVHLGAAVGTPVVAMASTIPPQLRWSAYENVTVIDGAQRIGCGYCHDAAHCRPGNVGSESLTDWGPPCLGCISPSELADKVGEVMS